MNCYTYQRTNNKENKEEKNKFFIKSIIIIFAVILLTAGFTFVFSSDIISENTNNFIKHEIESGESLWGIANQYYDNRVDLRKIVFEIKKLNDIKSALIRPGQEILIPLN